MPGMMGGAGGGFGPRRFEEQYHCYSVAYADKAHLEVRVCFVFLLFVCFIVLLFMAWHAMVLYCIV